MGGRAFAKGVAFESSRETAPEACERGRQTLFRLLPQERFRFRLSWPPTVTGDRFLKGEQRRNKKEPWESEREAKKRKISEGKKRKK